MNTTSCTVYNKIFMTQTKLNQHMKTHSYANQSKTVLGNIKLNLQNKYCEDCDEMIPSTGYMAHVRTTKHKNSCHQERIDDFLTKRVSKASSHHDHHKTLGGGEHPSPSGKSRRLSRCKRNTPHGSICYNGLCGTQQSMPSYFIKMLNVEFILTVDDIEYQHRLLSRSK